MDDKTDVQVLDFSGLNCPLPVLKTQKAALQAKKGDLIKVIATDPGSLSDIPAWCRRNSHELIDSEKQKDSFIFLIKI